MKKKSIESRLNKNNGKYKSEEEIEKIKNTFYKKYGCYGNLGREEVKSKSDKTQELIYTKNFIHSECFKQTMIERYGEVNPDYIPECISKMHTRYKFDGKNFDSSWELAYYIWLQDNNKTFEFHNKLNFVYEFEGKKHKYWPDFIVENKIVEIKNPILYERMLKENTLENAKYKCMLEHNVKIITDCSEYLQYIKNKYGTNYLRKFKNNK